MESFFNSIAEINDVINNFVWVKLGLVLLIGTGILMTLLTKVFQVSHFGHWMKCTIGKMFTKSSHKKEKGSITQFQALCTALAATVGVGNIAGVTAPANRGGGRRGDNRRRTGSRILDVVRRIFRHDDQLLRKRAGHLLPPQELKK